VMAAKGRIGKGRQEGLTDGDGGRRKGKGTEGIKGDEE